MKPKIFGKRPILMQRWEGGIRIIHIDGRVEYSSHLLHEGEEFANADGCTSRPTQEAAYKACVEYDKDYSGMGASSKSFAKMSDNSMWAYSAFLGYL